MNTILTTLRTFTLAAALLLPATGTLAAASEGKPFATHKVVLQISDGNPARQTLVLNVANNLIKHYGADKVDVEIVAFGPGLSLLFADNSNNGRIDSLADGHGVRFSACSNTIAAVTRMRGQEPALTPRATRVDAGVVQIMDLTADGYQLIKP